MYHTRSDEATAGLCVLVLALTWKPISALLSQTFPITHDSASLITLVLTVVIVAYVAAKLRL